MSVFFAVLIILKKIHCGWNIYGHTIYPFNHFSSVICISLWRGELIPYLGSFFFSDSSTSFFAHWTEKPAAITINQYLPQLRSTVPLVFCFLVSKLPWQLNLYHSPPDEHGHSELLEMSFTFCKSLLAGQPQAPLTPFLSYRRLWNTFRLNRTIWGTKCHNDFLIFPTDICNYYWGWRRHYLTQTV